MKIENNKYLIINIVLITHFAVASVRILVYKYSFMHSYHFVEFPYNDKMLLMYMVVYILLVHSLFGWFGLLTSEMKRLSMGIQKKSSVWTITVVLHLCEIFSLDITSSSPSNDGVTIHVHGRLIWWKSTLTNGPSFVDPSQLVIKLFPTER